MKRTHILTECAVCIALSVILSLLKLYESPLGGAVTFCSMVPILLISYRHGISWGCAAAFLYSVIQLLLGLSSLMYIPDPLGIALCILLDYILPFTQLGLAGASKLLPCGKSAQYLIGSGTVCLMRYILHIISGAVVWYSLTKAGAWNDLVFRYGMWSYSAIYNVIFMLPETVLTMIATPLLARALPAKTK